MKQQDNIIAAPQSCDTADLYRAWQQQRFQTTGTDNGSEEEFYLFLTTPSYQRSVLLDGFTPAIQVNEGVVITEYTA